MNLTHLADDALPTLALRERNRVLRNTYWLLALSMVPTVLGAWVGVTTGIAQALSPGVGLVVFLVGAFGFMFAIERTKNSAAGVPILLAFTFFMGVMLALGQWNPRPASSTRSRRVSFATALPKPVKTKRTCVRFTLPSPFTILMPPVNSTATC